jgi:hypothetical protein
VNDGSLLFLQHMIAKFEPVRSIPQSHASRYYSGSTKTRRSSGAVRSKRSAISTAS